MKKLALFGRKLRRLLPDEGEPYELFDTAVFVFVIATLGYVIEGAGPTQQVALNWIDGFFDLYIWGSFLAACAVVAIICSYIGQRCPHTLGFGYGLLVTGCLFWSSAFFVGVIFFDGTVRSIASVFVYGWVVRRLIAVRMRGQ